MFTMAEKPDWLVSLSKDGGAGGTAAEEGTATLLKGEMKDMLTPRNEGLRKAAPLGSAGNYYDLSTKGGQAARSTANCYVISAPGYYRIPLVYGNAITGGEDNTKSYICNQPTPPPVPENLFLRNFKDHLGNDIDNPWIEKTNHGANAGVNGARIVWLDEANLVHLANGSAAISHDAAGNAYLQFEVRASDIKSGNAVVAATKDGTVVWSWHLWFAPQSALTPIPFANYQGKLYNFTTETLGWKPTKWEGTVYQSPRSVKFRVEQTIANNGVKQYTDITITQLPGTIRKGYATFYQFGRKDPFPGSREADILKNTEAVIAYQNLSFKNCIQNPQIFYRGDAVEEQKEHRTLLSQYNLWSAENYVYSYNDNPVIKTVYDPSPAGFKMPATNAFTGSTRTGEMAGDEANVAETANSNLYKNNLGHNFWTNNNHTATIYMPALGCLHPNTFGLESFGEMGYYWTACPCDFRTGCVFFFGKRYVYPKEKLGLLAGCSVRPVTE